jgi:hypothetical protein
MAKFVVAADVHRKCRRQPGVRRALHGNPSGHIASELSLKTSPINEGNGTPESIRVTAHSQAKALAAIFPAVNDKKAMPDWPGLHSGASAARRGADAVPAARIRCTATAQPAPPPLPFSAQRTTEVSRSRETTHHRACPAGVYPIGRMSLPCDACTAGRLFVFLRRR